MANGNATADADLLNLLADSEPLGISDIGLHFSVTRTAVRERLFRLMGDGLVERELVRGGRGRPSYRYLRSHKARKLAGNNYSDLAAVLWQEVLGIEDSRRRQRVVWELLNGWQQLVQKYRVNLRVEPHHFLKRQHL